MRENLLGYVLGVLDAAERAEVERALAREPFRICRLWESNEKDCGNRFRLARRSKCL